VNADWGPISIKSGSETEINLSFLVSNLRDEKCVNGSCTSTSNFVQPFFGQIELFQLRKNGTPQLIEEWWDGGLVPPNWQGFVKGMRYRVEDQLIVPGVKYRLVATFQDPTDDYAIFLSGLKQMLIRQYSVEGSTVGIDSIPALSTLKSLGVIPGFAGVRDLSSNDQVVELREAINGLEKLIYSPIWPPYYNSICANDSGCMELGNKKFHQRLVLEFTAGQDLSNGIVKLENIKMRKDSPIFNGYPMQATEFPKFQCGE
jgi:hypothetical protein